MRRGCTIVIVPLLLATLVACASKEPSPGSVTFDSPTKPASSKPAKESDILAFKAPQLGGGQVIGSDLEGKDVAIWFWAPW